MAKQTEVNRIKSLNITDKNTTFSSNKGPCRYCAGEDYDIRSAKHDKILESIKTEKDGK